MCTEIRFAGPKGKGVFATAGFRQGELIERAGVVVIPAAETQWLDRSRLFHYYFGWDDETGDVALAMGSCSFMNHSYHPNACYVRDVGNETIDFYALRDVRAGEELTINYNGEPTDLSPLWFEVHG